MDPKKWGPGAWHLLHRVSVKIDASRPFYMSLKYVLPCRSCRTNIEKHITKLPFPTNSNKVAEWVYRIHNLVNDDLGVDMEVRPTFSDVKKKYKKGPNVPSEPEWVFIRCIAKIHPGARKITPEYEAALTDFINGMLGTTDVPFNVRSRTAFKEWISSTRLQQRP